MNVLIVSQCSKNALVETRRILDQFAERCGTRTWKTHITQQGLDALKKLLKRTARRNSAIACHWIRSKNYTELVWIIGNASMFSESGSVPTNTTEQDVLKNEDENDWHTLEDIQILSAIAALFHDFGKACLAFQKKLKKTNTKPSTEVYRHEWISLRLFEAFVRSAKDDQEWLTSLAKLEYDQDGLTEKSCIESLIKDGMTEIAPSPFNSMPSVAKAVGWLILTHHFLMKAPESASINISKLCSLLEKIGPEWNSPKSYAPHNKEEDIESCWQFTGKLKLPFSSKRWCELASYWGKRALKRNQLIHTRWLEDWYSLHLARLSLMLADHYYSSQPAHPFLGDPNFPLYANTERKTRALKQRLDEHLVGVAKHAKRIVKILPSLVQVLPRIARHKGFKQRTNHLKFSWQNYAYDLACSLRHQTEEQGFFGINMASTGCGKTLANGRIMYGLANPQRGARFSIALGLRTLTLQTGKVYRDDLKLGDDDLAILVGSSAVKSLFNLQEQKLSIEENNDRLKECGSESAESLIIDNTYVHYEGNLELGPLRQWIEEKSAAKKLISAPVLICTIDYLIGATEAVRGGKQIAPMLRLLTSDLVLDEPDDFDIEDLPALSRLVHWAGMLGSRILLSSATLSPALIEGLFNAYREGREKFQKSRGIIGLPVNICCAWFDEYNATASNQSNASSFMTAHNHFIDKRVANLQQAEVRRRAIIKPIDINASNSVEIRQQLASLFSNMLHELHQQHHTQDAETGKKISFGLIRFAHIDPLIDVAKTLFNEDAQKNHQIKICCYHSRHPLLIRNAIEERLDYFLDRRKSIFEKTEIKEYLANSPEDNLIFIVLASPVAEVGRDHDYDWAIVEPSSMRSIIQLAGRISRHRQNICNSPNIYLLNTNIKGLENSNNIAIFCRPGFEKQGSGGKFMLESHCLEQLLQVDEYEIITAKSRINARKNLAPKTSLVDLEHARLQALMLQEYSGNNFCASWWWDKSSQAVLSSVTQQQKPFRFEYHNKIRFALSYEEEDNEDCLAFFNIENEIPIKSNSTFRYQWNNSHELPMGKNVEVWFDFDYKQLLNELAEKLDMSARDCGFRFGYIDLEEETNWCYNPILGLRRN
jgi:CRISPR-associated endonuclease/helicase Cas3